MMFKVLDKKNRYTGNGYYVHGFLIEVKWTTTKSCLTFIQHLFEHLIFRKSPLHIFPLTES